MACFGACETDGDDGTVGTGEAEEECIERSVLERERRSRFAGASTGEVAAGAIAGIIRSQPVLKKVFN
jgi:hypothetical protein